MSLLAPGGLDEHPVTMGPKGAQPGARVAGQRTVPTASGLRAVSELCVDLVRSGLGRSRQLPPRGVCACVAPVDMPRIRQETGLLWPALPPASHGPGACEGQPWKSYEITGLSGPECQADRPLQWVCFGAWWSARILAGLSSTPAGITVAAVVSVGQ